LQDKAVTKTQYEQLFEQTFSSEDKISIILPGSHARNEADHNRLANAGG
jgi:hypothetical protein